MTSASAALNHADESRNLWDAIGPARPCGVPGGK